jgi:hypothetical protein
MKSTQREPLRSLFHCVLTLSAMTCLAMTCLAMTCLPGSADARSKLLAAEQFPGPWLEVTQEIRDVLTLKKVSACSQAMARQSSRDPDEYLLYCTRDETHWTSWRVRPAAQTIRGPEGLSEDIPLPDRY